MSVYRGCVRGAGLVLVLCATLTASPHARRTGAQAARAASDSTPAVGLLSARFTVDQDGQSTYTIPIAAPPGIGQTAPRVMLRYGSAMADGQVGMGWSVSGLSAIARCPASIALDGFAGTISYTTQDRYCLDGVRLINVQGAYGADGTIYRTVHESWQRIISHGSCGSGPCSFTVTTKQGNTKSYAYAVTAVGRADVRVWALDAVTDLHQNSYTAQYTADPIGDGQTTGEYYPLRIDYTANGKTGAAANRSIRFLYEARADDAVTYLGGAPLQTRARLARIQTFVYDAAVSDYRLTYDESAGTGRSRVTSIARCASVDATASCLTPTTFVSQNLSPAFAPYGVGLSGAFTVGQGWSDAVTPRTMADVNGDGRADIIGFKSGVQVALSAGSTLAAATTWASGFSSDQGGWNSETPRMFGDVNGDGLADLIGFSRAGISVGISTGSLASGGFDLKTWNGGATFPYFGQQQGWTTSLTPRLVADVNGDHRMDLVGFNNGVQVSVSTGEAFTTPETWATGFSSNGGWTSDTPRILADVNGDGMADIVGFGRKGVQVAISTGSLSRGGFDATSWNGGQIFSYFGADQGWTFDDTPRMMADVNGDGLSDLVGFKDGVQVALSTGVTFLAPTVWYPGFSTPQGWSKEMPRMMADMNGDGLADVVGFFSTGVQVALSTGDAFVTSTWNQQSLPWFGTQQGWSTTNNPRLLTDLNGDGLADVVGFGQQNVDVALSAGPFPDVVTAFTNGYGGRTRVMYAPLSDSAVYTAQIDVKSGTTAEALTQLTPPTPAAGRILAFPTQRLLGGLQYVVAATTRENDAAINRAAYAYTRTFRYANADMNLLGLGWLGYRTLTTSRGSDGQVDAIQTYFQDYPRNGTLERQELNCRIGDPHDPACLPGKTTLTVRQFARDAIVTAVGATDPSQKVYEIEKRSGQTDFYTYGTLDFSLRRTYEYDTYGNVTRLTDAGMLDATGQDRLATDNVYTCRSYDNDVDRWQLGYPRAAKQSRTADCADVGTFNNGQDFALQQFDYVDATRDLRSERRWDDTRGAYLTQTYAYDDYGNQTSTTPPAGQPTTTTFETTFHTYPETIVTPPNQAGQSLTMVLGFDPRFGVRVAGRDANGRVTVKCLDAFGRAVATQGPIPAASRTPADTNCVPAGVTGPAASFSSATVATLAAQRWDADAGAIYEEHVIRQTWAQTPIWRWERDYYDGLHRRYEQVQQGRDGRNIARCLVFNASSRVTQQSLPFYLANPYANCLPGGDAPFWVSIAYDVYGRPITLTRPSGPDGKGQSITTNAYPTRDKVTQTRAAGTADAFVKTLTYAYYNSQKQTTTLVVPSDGNATTRFAYDPIGRLLSTTDPATRDNPAGVTVAIAFDSLNRRTTLSNPDVGETTYAYAATGLMEQARAPAGTLTYSYDALQRLTRTTRPDGSASVITYDEPGASNGLGNATTAAVVRGDGSRESSYAFAYDDYNRPVRSVLTLEGEPATFTSVTEFDPLNRNVRYVYPDQSTVDLAYTDGSLTSLTSSAGVSATWADFTASGLAGLTTYGNGTTIAQTYWPTGEPLTVRIADATGAVLVDDAFAWNGLQKNAGIVDRTSGGRYSQQFTYENLRLVRAEAPQAYGTRTFGYDASGNTTAIGDMALTYQHHQAVRGTKNGAELFAATYQAGNMRTKQTPEQSWTYGFDATNRLASARESSRSAASTFVYDYAGQRLRQVSPDGTRTVYVGRYVQVTPPSQGAKSTRYVAAGAGLIAAVESGAPTYYYPNRIGSTALIMPPAAAARRILYEPYGAAWDGSPPLDSRYRFAGQEQDDDTGLYYFTNRYYDASIGRFLSADPGLGVGALTQPTALNAYNYALDDPINNVDPLGLSVWSTIANVLVDIASAVLDVVTDGGAAAVTTEIDVEMGAMEAATTAAELTVDASSGDELTAVIIEDIGSNDTVIDINDVDDDAAAPSNDVVIDIPDADPAAPSQPAVTSAQADTDPLNRNPMRRWRNCTLCVAGEQLNTTAENLAQQLSIYPDPPNGLRADTVFRYLGILGEVAPPLDNSAAVTQWMSGFEPGTNFGVSFLNSDGSGHIISATRTAAGDISFYDPQLGPYVGHIVALPKNSTFWAAQLVTPP